MPIKSRTYLKSRFETELEPTEADYVDLIDSLAHLTEDSLTPGIWGQITGTLTNQADLVAYVAAQAGIADVVSDITPQLGGMLDVNGQSIGDGTRELLKFLEDGSAANALTVFNAAAGSPPGLRQDGITSGVGMKLLLDTLAGLNVSNGTTGALLDINGDGTLGIYGNIIPQAANTAGTLAAPFADVISDFLSLEPQATAPTLTQDGVKFWVSDGTVPWTAGTIYASIRSGGTTYVQVIENIETAMPKNLTTGGYVIRVTDAAVDPIAEIGETTDGAYFAHTFGAGGYNVEEGAFVVGSGFARMQGGVANVASLADSVVRQVLTDADGNLFAVPHLDHEYEETATSGSDFDLGSGTGTGAWVKVGLQVTTSTTLLDKFHIRPSLYVENKDADEAGEIEVGYGIAGAAPLSTMFTVYTPGNFAHKITQAIEITGGLASGSVIDIWARRASGTGAAFGLDVLGGTTTSELSLHKEYDLATFLNVGELYGSAITVTVSVADTYYLIALDTKGEEHGVTVDTGNSDIEVLEDGVYRLDMSISFSGANNNTLGIGLAKNGTVIAAKSERTRVMNSAGDVGIGSTHCYATLVAGDKITGIAKNVGATANITVDSATMTVQRIA